MSSRPRISIAMAVYNGARFIQEQLESFVRQTCQPDELVISDNCSTDSTVTIIQEFARRASFPVRLFINDRNLGVSKNFERAISECSGDIIFLSDCDDVWYPEKIRVMTDALKAQPDCAMAICDAHVVDVSLNPMGVTVWETYHFKPRPRVREELARAKFLNPSIPAAGNCLAFRAHLRDLVLPFPEGEQFRRGWFDRFLVWISVLSGNGGIFLVERPLLAFRQHGGNTSGVAGRSLRGLMRARWNARKKRGLPAFPILIERLEGAEQRGLPPSYLRDSILRHWRTRCSLPRRRLARFPQVVRELVTWRYHRFSNGFPTALKDLLFAE